MFRALDRIQELALSSQESTDFLVMKLKDMHQ